MATIGLVLRRIIPLAIALALAAPGSSAATQEQRAPVAFYDAESVARGARALAPERVLLDETEARYAAEIDPLARAVHRLRAAVVRGAGLPDAERRDLEARLAQSTIALIVARTEAAEEIALERDRLRASLERRVVPAVARVAREHGLAVVIRTDAATVVLDEDALDVTSLVIEALDETREAPGVPSPRERRRARVQSCETGASTGDGASSSLGSQLD